MLRKILSILVVGLFTLNMACSSNESSNANVNAVNLTNTISPTNMPPGLSTTPVPLSANSTPGIPDPKTIGVNNAINSNAPIPGIPDPKTIGKTPMPKNTPPIPGIPDEETLKKQMKTVIKDANVVNISPKTDANSIKTPTDQRPVRKP